MNTKLDPWGSASIEDYSKLFDEFGISPFDKLLKDIRNPPLFMRRKIIFGHRDYNIVLQAMQNNQPFAVLSGFMPSGRVHLGGKMVMEEIIWHQKMGGKAFVAIADMEAHSVRGMSWQKCKDIGINEYILSLIALGFEPDGYIYFQSKNSDVKDLEFELGIETKFSELNAIYGFSGETNIAHMQSVLIQSADIFLPQLSKYGGPKPVVIPVGSDQDPHMRLTRDLANRMRMFTVVQQNDNISVRSKAVEEKLLINVADRISSEISCEVKLYKEHIDIFGSDDFKKIDSIVRNAEIEFGGYGFIQPASTYHRFMTGLTGGKMSSSNPDSYIALTDAPEDAYKKVMKAKTGGRATLSEQKKIGGEPEKCVVYELLQFHLIEEDKYLTELYLDCKSGKKVCGECKKMAAGLIKEFLKMHQYERENAKDRLNDYEILGL